MDNSIASRLRRKKRLGDLLLGAGVITQEQLEEALKKQKEAGNGQKLGMTLVDMGIMNDEIIAEALCHQMGLERVHLAGITIEDEVLALVDEKVLRKYMLLPYEFAPDNPNVLRVAFSDPLDMIAMDDLSIITGMQIEVRVTTVKDVSQALDRFYGNSEAMKVQISLLLSVVKNMAIIRMEKRSPRRLSRHRSFVWLIRSLSRQYIKEHPIFTLNRWRISSVSGSVSMVCFRRRCVMIFHCCQRWLHVSRSLAVWIFPRSVNHRMVV